MSTSWHRLPGPWWSAGNHPLSETAFWGLQLWVTTHTREPGVVTLETVKLFGVGTHEAKSSGKRQPVEISDVEFDPCVSAKQRRARLLADQLAQVKVMHEVLSSRLDRKDRTAYWCQKWEFEVLKAADVERFNRNLSTWLRFTALVSAVFVSTLAGISISVSGPSSTFIRVTTLVLGLISALATGAIAVFRSQERWLMYRRLQSDLMTAAWKLINACADDTKDKSWETFVKETDHAMHTYDRQYQSAVIANSQQTSK